MSDTATELTAATIPTLYINNINEKVKKGQMVKMLYMVFCQYGKVVNIFASRKKALRGQAWVTFREPEAAAKALQGKQGFNFYDKKLCLQYAKSVSEVITLTTDSKDNKPSGGKRKRDADSNEEDENNNFKATKV